MTASVVSGVISDTDPTKVVLPTPKPPATTIFTDAMAAAVASPPAALELAKSTEHPFEQVEVRASMRVVGLVDPDQSFHRHVRDQYAGHAQRHPEYRGDLGDRSPVPAEAEDHLAFRTQRREIACLVVRGGHHSFDLQLSPGLGPAAGHRVRTDQGTRGTVRGAGTAGLTGRAGTGDSSLLRHRHAVRRIYLPVRPPPRGHA